MVDELRIDGDQAMSSCPASGIAPMPRRPASSSRTAPARAWRMSSWKPSPVGLRRASDRHPALPVSLSWNQGSRRPGQPRHCRQATVREGGRGRDRRSARDRPADVRRRQVVRRPHDLSGAGRRGHDRRSSASSFVGFPLHLGQEALDRRARHTSTTCACADAVPAGHPRRACRGRADRRRRRSARHWHRRDPLSWSRARTIPSACRGGAAAPTRRRWPRCSTRRRHGSLM